MTEATRIALLSTALGLALSGAAHAQEPVYFGLGVGFMDPDQRRLDEAFNGSLTVGQRLQDRRFAVEGTMSVTLIEGDVDAPVVGDDEWDITTLAGYGAFRAGNELYLKAKAGLVYWEADVGAREDDDIDASFGFGGGARLGNGVLELEYTRISDDFDLLGATYLFNF